MSWAQQHSGPEGKVIIYRCQEGDTLDRICWLHYGRESAVPRVIEANPGISDLGPYLPAGTLVTLPDLADPPRQTVQLWD